MEDKDKILYDADGLRVLIMDDEESVRDSVGDLLAAMGFRVALAENGEQALQLYKTAADSGEMYDVAVLDLTVKSGMGGLEAAQKILLMHPEARLIASSGYTNDPAITSYGEYGFAAVVDKPYKVETLQQIIRAVTSSAKG